MGKTTGGGLLAAMLRAEGVDTVFGIPDGTYLSLLTALRDAGVRIVTPRHETTAVHMAGAYARLTGRLGVALASNGPGVANALPGATVENAEGNRVLLLTSSRRVGITAPDRGGAYQHFDQVAALGAVTKWSTAATATGRIPELLRQALRRSFSGRPGVVHLDVPEDVLGAKTDARPVLEPARYRRVGPLVPDPDAVERTAELLATADLPVLHAGGGVLHAGASAALTRVAELLHAPVTTSWSGRGAVAETNPLVWPITAIEPVRRLRHAADVVLVVGSRLGETDWWGRPPQWRAEQRIVQVDVDDRVFGATRPVEVAVVADARVFLEALAAALEHRVDAGVLERRRRRVAPLVAVREAEAAKLARRLSDVTAPMVTAHVPAICRELCDDDAIFVVDGGNTAVWANFYLQVRAPNTFLTTPHFGMLGAGVGQALGAAVARPDRQVCCIIGDGAFGMHPQEVETAVRNGLRVVFVVVSDRQWGMVKLTQSMAARPVKMLLRRHLDPEETINSDLGEIAYDELARAMGAHGERVADPAGLRTALNRALEARCCAVVHVDVDPTKHLWAPGLRQFRKMHQEPGGE